ncbi:MAG: hypothetical protein R3E75_01905 [Steroidobacteraceae bacterium]
MTHRRTTCLLSALATALVLAVPFPATAGGFDRASFQDWVDMRTGGNGKPVYWFGRGNVLDSTGTVVARVEGLDTSLGYPDPSRPDTWIQLSRKIFILLDPKTGQRQLGRDGKPIPPTAYPFQVRSYRLEGDEIVYDVESHDSARVFAQPTLRNFSVHRIGRVTHYNYPMFIDRVRLDGQRAQRYEVNDLLLRADPGLTEQERYQYTYVGTGPGGTVSSVVSWRYSDFDALPSETLKTFVRNEAPLWLTPPKDMAEIAALRAQQPWRGPGSAAVPAAATPANDSP